MFNHKLKLVRRSIASRFIPWAGAGVAKRALFPAAWCLALGASMDVETGRLELAAVNPGSELGSWLVSATAALSIAALLKQFARKTPLEAEFLSRKEFNDFKTKVDQEFASLRDRIDNSFRSLADKLDAINNRLHDVRASVDRLDERTQTAHAWSPEIKQRRSTTKTPEPKNAAV